MYIIISINEPIANYLFGILNCVNDHENHHDYQSIIVISWLNHHHHYHCFCCQRSKLCAPCTMLLVAPKLRPLNNLNWVEINLLHQKCSKENISRCEANLEISTVHQRNAVGLSCLFHCSYFMFKKTNYEYVFTTAMVSLLWEECEKQSETIREKEPDVKRKSNIIFSSCKRV